ncbi:hypothetical protein BFP97_04785 [Roseivirga sp. 4D4]|uniref:DUF4249 family protein n=1 Tax=Roseivirga sp. 4D4 TaxID=1889784 RepID=UPI0008531A6A|nr:DUF4249 family protein [Roseivirga sp. 4D4]OEK00865.1 hypothetical protein BFP97_04785 [Roseivirga sp. 4D4]
MNKKVISKRMISAVLAIAITWLMMAGCAEVIELGSKPTAPSLIVYGRITDGTAGNEITIFESSTRSDGAQQALSGATIDLLEDGSVIAQYEEELNNPGNYRLVMPNDSAREGRSYQIAITLPSGEQVLSEPSIMPGLKAKDSIYVEVDLVDVVVDQGGIRELRRLSQLLVDTEILEKETDFYLRWNVIETYTAVQTQVCCGPPPPPCYVTNDITGQALRLFNGAKLKPDLIPRQNLANTTVDGRFAFTYFYQVVQSTIDEGAHAYWTKVEEIANLSGSIFDKTPANIVGNLYYPDRPKDPIFGYFEVARVDTTRTWLNSDRFDFFLREPCPAARLDEAPPECGNCLLIENSSHHRPYFYQ